MNVREWFEQELWEDVFFAPQRLQPKRLLYTVDFVGPKLKLLINGFVPHAPWSSGNSVNRADALFDAVKPLVGRFGASVVYIHEPDGAYSEIVQLRDHLDPVYCRTNLLWWFDRNPADQAGPAYLCLVFHGQNALLVFRQNRGIEISCYGNPQIAEEICQKLFGETKAE